MLRNSRVNLDFSSQTRLRALQKPRLSFPAPLPPSLSIPSPPPATPGPVAGKGSRPPSATHQPPRVFPQPGLQPRTLGTVRASVWGHAPCWLLRTQMSKALSSLQGAPSQEGGFHSVKVAVWGQRHEPQEELCAGCPALARGSAVTESAVCAHQTVSRWSRAPSHSSRRPGCLPSGHQCVWF